MATDNLKTIFERFKARVADVRYIADPWVDGDLKERAAKAWAHEHGYFGAVGGWIHKGESQEAVTRGDCSKGVVQGWDSFYSLFRTQILDWFAQRLTASPDFKTLTSPAPGSTYRPTLLVLKPADWGYAFLASSYDVAMKGKGDRRRAYTGHGPSADEAQVRAAHAAAERGEQARQYRLRAGWILPGL